MTGEYVISVKGLEKVFEDGNAALCTRRLRRQAVTRSLSVTTTTTR